VVGEKRAREIWFMLRRLTAEEALDWGLVNRVVPAADLKAEVRAWADQMLEFSPTAIKVLKQSFNTDTEHMISLGNLAYSTLQLFGETEEAREGITAFNEKRQPQFGKYRSH
jgi:naphthoate synthase